MVLDCLPSSMKDGDYLSLSTYFWSIKHVIREENDRNLSKRWEKTIFMVRLDLHVQKNTYKIKYLNKLYDLLKFTSLELILVMRSTEVALPGWGKALLKKDQPGFPSFFLLTTLHHKDPYSCSK